MKRIAIYLASAAAIVVGCRGSVDRTYFDDEADTTGSDGSFEDRTSPTGDSSSGDNDATSDAANDASNDVVTDAADGGDAAEAGVPRTVGGVAVGLVGTGMVLQLNGANDVAVNPEDGGANVSFSFAKTLIEGENFAVTIKTQPVSQQCSVSGGTGTIGSGNVTTIIVNCIQGKYTIGGNLTGVEGTITLLNNGGDALTLNNSGSFAFSAPLADLAPYSVSIDSHSALPEQTCTLSNESGNVAGANVTNIAVACTTKSYVLSGSATGVTGGTLLLSNGGDSVNVLADGSFEFPTKVLSNRSYDVQVAAPPAGKKCIVTNGSGTVTTADVGNVSVKCVPQFVLTENFDLMSAWATSRIDNGAGNPSLWGLVTAASGQLPAPNTAPNAAQISNTSQIVQIVLTSPQFTVDTDTATATFKIAYALEAALGSPTVGYDGVVLEYSTNNGTTWSDIGSANFTAGGYTRTISASFDNPLANREAWSGWSTPNVWTTSTVKLPLTAGQSARLRFQLGTDKRNVDCEPSSNRACIGFRLDTISIAN